MGRSWPARVNQILVLTGPQIHELCVISLSPLTIHSIETTGMTWTTVRILPC